MGINRNHPAFLPGVRRLVCHILPTQTRPQKPSPDAGNQPHTPCRSMVMATRHPPLPAIYLDRSIVDLTRPRQYLSKRSGLLTKICHGCRCRETYCGVRDWTHVFTAYLLGASDHRRKGARETCIPRGSGSHNREGLVQDNPGLCIGIFCSSTTHAIKGFHSDGGGLHRLFGPKQTLILVRVFIWGTHMQCVLSGSSKSRF